ncbi:serine palmitoyltransferase 3-like [Octopus sinensis]|uniref:serine C-palmitoyltransferase n=1 Tax=Octopus sinensis TaxID=2607531 RepID=A0A7E6EGW0_9MOLL|nr:serine palmitoyltransferase 3-like [Octopus sinensis]XP_036355369.1 serine palmitoyltransferase 3-like [Octopus sinensis]
MEGTILKLPRLISLKKQYKAYLFIDEAHSIGSLGPRGGGVCDYWNVDPREVDILMGTFTKSFGGCGGYLAGSHSFINYIRNNSCFMDSTTMPPPVATQISKAIQIIQTPSGIERLKSLKRNLSYFRRRLKEMGFLVYGHRDSPVVPVVFSSLAKIDLIGKYSLDSGLALTLVGSPATSLMGARIRFCISSGHTREMLDKVYEYTNINRL